MPLEQEFYKYHKNNTFAIFLVILMDFGIFVLPSGDKMILPIAKTTLEFYEFCCGIVYEKLWSLENLNFCPVFTKWFSDCKCFWYALGKRTISHQLQSLLFFLSCVFYTFGILFVFLFFLVFFLLHTTHSFIVDLSGDSFIYQKKTFLKSFFFALQSLYIFYKYLE